MKAIIFSVVRLDTVEEVYRGLYSECLEYLKATFEEVRHHGVVIIQSKLFDHLSMKRG